MASLRCSTIVLLCALALLRPSTCARDLKQTANKPAECNANDPNVVAVTAGNQTTHKAHCRAKPGPLLLLPNPQNLTLNEFSKTAAFTTALQQGIDDYMTLVNNVIQEFCWVNSGSGCDEVDTDGSHGFWKQYFAGYQTLTNDLSYTDVHMNDDGKLYKSSYCNYTCQYDPYAAGSCRLDGQTIVSNSVTETHTQTYSYQGRVGFNIKVKGGVGEATWEQTFDFGYSTTSGTVDTKLEGETTVASISVPMSPDDPRCVVIAIILQRVQQTGSVAVYVRSNGWVGTHQNSAKNWKYIDNPGETHYFRAFWFPWLVAKAQELGRPTAQRWTVGNDGYAYMYTPFNLVFDVANTGYANPMKFPKDNPRCKPF